MKTGRAFIIGGSLGGLFAANLLHQQGWQVEVFERVGDDLASRGAGIGTHDELFTVLERIGITIDRTIGVPGRNCLDQSGKVIAYVPALVSAFERCLPGGAVPFWYEPRTHRAQRPSALV